MATLVERERVRERLASDYGYYAPRCLKIVDTARRVVPLTLNKAQLKLETALEQQRDAGLPERAMVLKARKVGISTTVQGMLIHRATQRPNHRAQVVAHDNDTAGALFDIGKFMWASLPGEVKPGLQAERNSKGGQKYMAFGEPSIMRRREGTLGLNSTIEIDTAREVQSGRGLTVHALHLSEVAFWSDERKMVALLNAVPDDPGTLVVQESTANGQNHFKDAWDRAEAGDSAYAPVFIAWHEDERYERPFASAEERDAFSQDVGQGPWGDEEPGLITTFGLTLEQLNWRRWTIANKCEASLPVFHQEYPSTPEQAFLTTGRKVFSRELLGRVLEEVQISDPVVPSKERPGPRIGVLEPAGWKQIRAGGGVTVSVPTGVRFMAGSGSLRQPLWRVWEAPVKAHLDRFNSKVPDGQYVVSLDPMSGDERESGELAWHAIEVLDHRSRAQVAEYRSRIDPDDLAMQLLMAAMFWNQAWVSIEMTGGWGLSIARKLAIAFKYPYLYTRQPLKDERAAKFMDRIGWDTNRATKPLLIDGAKELLKAKHGIRSRLLAREMLSYVKDERGRTMAEHGKTSDLLMAWMIGQQVAQERPVRERKKPPSTTSTRSVTSEVTGW